MQDKKGEKEWGGGEQMRWVQVWGEKECEEFTEKDKGICWKEKG